MKHMKKLDTAAKNAVKFNDLVLFDYSNVKDFVVLNCNWNIDKPNRINTC
jgi:hypothetical protein